MTDLFPDLPETLSPRAAWMRRHGIKSEHATGQLSDDYWQAWQSGNADVYGSGETEFDALSEIALILNITTWHQ